MITEYQIRVQIIATADDDGSNAANISASTVASRLTTVNQVLAPATIEFVFDQTDDFLKINSTLLNRDFTLLELPNLDGDKWDHKPLVDSESHNQARTNLCKQFSGKLVVIFRNRKKLDQDEDGNWLIVTKGGGSSSANSLFVNMSTNSQAVDLAHEMGHYLQLPHTFSTGVKTVADAAAKIKSYVEDGHDQDDGLEKLDGDRNVLLDTPADCKGTIFESEGLEVCGDVGEVIIPVNFGDVIRLYTLEPDRNLVMSYFKGCSETGDKTISAQQARRVRDGLELRHRHDLIGIKPSFSYNIVRGATGTGGTISEIDVALVRAGRVATVVRDGGGKVKVIVWDIEDNGNTITRVGSGEGGAVSKVAICGLGANMVATPVTTSGELKIIIWRIEEDGDVTRLGDATAEGQISDVACCIARYDMGNNYMATAVRRGDLTLKVDVWQTFANGTITHMSGATAGEINVPKTGLKTPRLTISDVGAQGLVTCVRNENNELKTILWEFDEDEKLTRLDSAALDAPSIGSISGCNVAREVTVAAIQDKDKKLKLIAYAFPEDAKFMAQRGTASAGSISGAEICRLGTEMVVTAVGVSGDKLKLILWQVTKTGDHIIRLDDAATDEVFGRLSMCYTDRNQWATALRDGDGKLKIIVWRTSATLSSNLNKDIFKQLFDNAPQARDLKKKINLARGGECDDEDSLDNGPINRGRDS